MVAFFVVQAVAMVFCLPWIRRYFCFVKTSLWFFAVMSLGWSYCCCCSAQVSIAVNILPKYFRSISLSIHSHLVTSSWKLPLVILLILMAIHFKRVRTCPILEAQVVIPVRSYFCPYSLCLAIGKLRILKKVILGS